MDNEIVEQILDCKSFIISLSINVSGYEETVTWFKELCKELTDLLDSATAYIRNLKEKCDNNVVKALLLHLTQLTTLLSLLIKVFLTEHEVKVVISEARNCVCKQLVLCLEGLRDVVVDTAGEDGSNKCFLMWMDSSLDKLSEIDVSCGRDFALTKYGEARRHVEEVLCHAMSIAQVALHDDSKIIKGGSKTVLGALDSLLLDIDKTQPNVAMCNLSIDSCHYKLCALERKVNTAVLRLSLRVFSKYIKPLETLHSYCIENTAEYDVQEFDNIIADFDVHVDRIMQIGLFAVTSSTDTSCGIKMKSCLASLEALEGELVPSFNALILEKSTHNVSFALLLKHYWIRQAESLKRFIYSIIDPFAFCQIAYEELRQLIDDARDNMRNNGGVLNQKLVEPITNETDVLRDVICASTEDMVSDNNVDEIKSLLRDLKSVLHETKCAVRVLLVDSVPDKQGSARVMKRCKVLLTVVRKLLLSLSEDANATEIINTQFEPMPEISKDRSNINQMNEANDLMENHFLNHIINRGKQILKDRSVLYKTPTKSVITRNGSAAASKLPSAKSSKPVPLSKLVHLRNLQFSYSKGQNNTSLDLQITEILNDLENLSASFTQF